MASQTRSNISRRWEAGELGCSQLIVGLKRELSHLNDGELLELITHDGGARIDIPAWTYLTGHELVSENHPIYIIRK